MSIEKNLIWIDLEMTGLNTVSDSILEIATVVTSSELDILAQGPVLAIHQSEEILVAMDEWNQRCHSRSGLIDRVRASTVTEREAEILTIDFLEKWVISGYSPMCGNSICQDRRFLHRCMPALEKFFHYRQVDVSTIKELYARWYGSKAEKFIREIRHEALSDTIQAIEELKFYRSKVFRSVN